MKASLSHSWEHGKCNLRLDTHFPVTQKDKCTCKHRNNWTSVFCWSLILALFPFQSESFSCRNFIPNRFINLLNNSYVSSLAQDFLEVRFINPLLVKLIFPLRCPSDIWNTVCTKVNHQLLSTVCSHATFSVLQNGYPTLLIAQARDFEDLFDSAQSFIPLICLILPFIPIPSFPPGLLQEHPTDSLMWFVIPDVLYSSIIIFTGWDFQSVYVIYQSIESRRIKIQTFNLAHQVQHMLLFSVSYSVVFLRCSPS